MTETQKLVPERPAPDREELLRMLGAHERVSFREFMNAANDGRLHPDEIEEFWPGWHEHQERMKKLVGDLGVVASKQLKKDLGPMRAAIGEASKLGLAGISESLRGIGADRARLASLTALPEIRLLPPPRNYQLEALVEMEGRLGELIEIEDRSLGRMANLELLTGEVLANAKKQRDSARAWNIGFAVIFGLTLVAASIAAAPTVLSLLK